MLVKLGVYFLVIDFLSVTGSLAEMLVRIAVYFLVIDSVTGRLARDGGKTGGVLARA